MDYGQKVIPGHRLRGLLSGLFLPRHVVQRCANWNGWLPIWALPVLHQKFGGMFPARREAETGQQKATLPMFTIPGWHKPHAKALMESDPAGRQALIKDAERAILLRLLEVQAASLPAQEYESSDLRNAVTALTQLKNPNKIAYFDGASKLNTREVEQD